MKRSAKVQAAAALGLAAVLWGGWALFGTPVRVRWLVARGATPAPAAVGDACGKEIRALGVGVRPLLLDLFRGSGSRARRSWIADLLLGPPFYAEGEIVKDLASPDRTTARAAAFALLEGEEDPLLFEEAAAQAEVPPGARPPRRPLNEAWDPAPAVPVLAEWVGDRGDREAILAARLLGAIPSTDAARTEALLRVVDEAPGLLAEGLTPAADARKQVVAEAIQSLLGTVRTERGVMERVLKALSAIEAGGLTEQGWGIEIYLLRLVELGRGEGMPPELLEKIASNPNPIVRQKLAGTLQEVPGGRATDILERLCLAPEPVVRRAAVLSLLRRRDPRVLRLAPWLVEDSYIYIASDTLHFLSDLRMADPAGCRAALPLLVSCLEDPWPGEDPPAATTQARFLQDGRASIIDEAALCLYRIANACPGFTLDEIVNQKKRGEIARRLLGDPQERKKIADEWRKSVAPWTPPMRIPALVRHLGESEDPDNVVRAARELVRITADSTGFPPAVLARTPDDTEARNAVREWRRTADFRNALAHWKGKAGL